jgi:hypothetical protein
LAKEASADKIAPFLGRRCSVAFVARFMSLHQEMFDYLCHPGSYLHARLETELIPKLQDNNLFPVERRRELIESVKESIVEANDADFLTIARVRAVFSASEQQELLDAIRSRLLPQIEEEVRRRGSGYDGEESPDEYFSALQETLDAYREAFEDDPSFQLIQKALERLEYEKDAADDYYRQYGKREPEFDREEFSENTVEAGERSIFDDVDQ